MTNADTNKSHLSPTPLFIGWEDARELPAGTRIERTVLDDTLPGGPKEKTITYIAPFGRCDREEDYRTVWPLSG